MGTQYTYENLKKDFSVKTLKRLLLQEGYTYRELQKEFCYNERLWSRYAKENGIPKQEKNIRKNSINRSTKQLPMNKIVSLYVDEHKSLHDIAKIFNVSHRTIGKKLRKEGVEIRPFYSSYYYDKRRGGSHKETVDNFGYIVQDGDRQHRNIARSKLDRPLSHIEAVHHIDHNKNNNNPSNLYVFPDNRCHMLFHGQKWTTSPEEFEAYYNDILLNTVYNKEWLFNQYITLNKSVSQISKELHISRGTITKSLRNFNIYNLRERRVNQHDL